MSDCTHLNWSPEPGEPDWCPDCEASEHKMFMECRAELARIRAERDENHSQWRKWNGEAIDLRCVAEKLREELSRAQTEYEAINHALEDRSIELARAQTERDEAIAACQQQHRAHPSWVLKGVAAEQREAELEAELARAQAERDEARTEASAADMQLRGALIWAGTFGGYAPGHLKHSAQGAWDEINRLRKLLNESDAERREMKRDFTEFMHDEGAKRFKAEADRDHLRAALTDCLNVIYESDNCCQAGTCTEPKCARAYAALTQARALLTTQDPDTNGQ